MNVENKATKITKIKKVLTTSLGNSPQKNSFVVQRMSEVNAANYDTLTKRDILQNCCSRTTEVCTRNQFVLASSQV